VVFRGPTSKVRGLREGEGRGKEGKEKERERRWEEKGREREWREVLPPNLRRLATPLVS